MEPESASADEYPSRGSWAPSEFNSNSLPIDLQPPSSDTASTVTLAASSTTTLTSTTSDEIGSSLCTTPDIGDIDEELHKLLDFTAQVSRQIEAETAQQQQQEQENYTVATDEQQTASTRRRSTRIKPKETPLQCSNATFATPTTTKTRSLRSVNKKSQDEQDAEATPDSSFAKLDTELSRAANQRASMGFPPKPDEIPRAAETPSGTGTKRSHAVMAAGSKSVPSKPNKIPSIAAIAAILGKPLAKGGRNYIKKAKLAQMYKEIDPDGTLAAQLEKAPAAPKAPKTPAARAAAKATLKKTPRARAASTSGSTTSSASSATPEEDEPIAPTVKRKKVWIDQGLYVGQEDDTQLNMRPATKGKKGRKSTKRGPALPLPMYRGKEILETRRDFKLPHHVFAPNPVKQSPPHWRKLNHNQLIGDAQQIWRKEKSGAMKCQCEGDCSEQCLNRVTWVECTDETCSAGERCVNRSFAKLKERVKSESKFHIGVEVALTINRGHGLRALRSFEPGQIIVEYTGEIITQEESERRLEEVYKHDSNYYLMLFDQNMILDATRGSIARFVNHSCAPNCTMEKWMVDGRPRMALFAGDEGVEAGSELTYDYNFTWFKGVTQSACKCGAPNCRGVMGRRNDRKDNTPPKVVKKVTRKYVKKIKTERVQKSAIISPAKPKRKPPTQRRPLSPKTSAKEESGTPELEPLAQSSDDEDESEFSEITTPPSKIDSSPNKPVLKSSRNKNRVLKTYKVNKTIQHSSIAKSITSESAVSAARAMAFEEALAGVGNENIHTMSVQGMLNSVAASLASGVDDLAVPVTVDA